MSKEENISEMMDKAIQKKLDAIEESKKSKDNYEKLSDKIDESINKNKNKSSEQEHDHSHMPNNEKVHVHATHSDDETCPGCGEKNPDYNSDQATCTDCGGNVGTIKEIESGNITTCKTCGGHEAEHKSKGYRI